jgi:hypothetical protein
MRLICSPLSTKGDIMNKLIKTALATAALTLAASTAMALSVSTSCGGGTCKVTVDGVTKTFKGSYASVSASSRNGVSTFSVYIDGQKVNW